MYCMVLSCIAFYSIVVWLRCVALCVNEVHLLSCVVLVCIVLYRVVSVHVVLYLMVVYCVVQ